MSFNPAGTLVGPAETDSTEGGENSPFDEGEFTQMRDTAGVGAKDSTCERAQLRGAKPARL